tara:strand:- start:981 stop:1208 length:228 start_codon:yes stop_codon:yes gene_type:complete
MALNIQDAIYDPSFMEKLDSGYFCSGYMYDIDANMEKASQDLTLSSEGNFMAGQVSAPVYSTSTGNKTTSGGDYN